MQVLYSGFDGLDVSFAGQICAHLSDAMEIAKIKAGETHQTALMEWNGLSLLVHETGARGGYAYMASTGPFGATWFFKKPSARDPWGVRVSCNSFNLATKGLGGARAELYQTLALLGVSVDPGAERIGRVDYAIDFLAPQFVLNPQDFVMHAKARRADHMEQHQITTNGSSGRNTSVTVGTMPGRQVIVYDKRQEVISKAKVGWWTIWDAARADLGLPHLARETALESRIWRVELRAGKQHLKERWAIRTWADLDERLGDMLAACLKAVRHTDPSADTNRSRWPNSELWQQVSGVIAEDLFEMRNGADPDLIKLVERDAHDRLLARQMVGLLTTRAALASKGTSELQSFAISVGQDMANEIGRDLSHFEAKLVLAKGRYRLA